MNIKQISVLVSRIALFVIYFWFGLLKVVGQSNPQLNEMAQGMLSMTMPFLPFSSFIVLFGLLEMLIGILFFIPKLEKVAVGIFAFHMLTTTLPLFMMSKLWIHFLVPNLEAQYIIKNLALVGCALTIWVASSEPKPRPIDSVLSTM